MSILVGLEDVLSGQRHGDVPYHRHAYFPGRCHNLIIALLAQKRVNLHLVVTCFFGIQNGLTRVGGRIDPGTEGRGPGFSRPVDHAPQNKARAEQLAPLDLAANFDMIRCRRHDLNRGNTVCQIGTEYPAEV